MRFFRFIIRNILGSTELTIISAFLTIIIAGSIALVLPIANTAPINYLDSIFTSTSAVCVTGLIVRDTGRDFSTFGQVIIIILIQLGGLGIMTIYSLIAFLIGKKLAINSKYALYNSFFQKETAHNLKRVIFGIIGMTVFIESLGAIFIYSRIKDGFSSIFHSVSAFCNAGFSLYSDSLIGFNTDSILLSIFMILIFLGGIGYIVFYDLYKYLTAKIRNIRQTYILTLHTKVVLFTSLMLIISGGILILLFGFKMDESVFTRIANSVFQSVTSRTAGFNSIEISELPVNSLFFISLLMFIGGSPGSCAGGIKTTVFFVLMLYAIAMIKGKESVTFFNREIRSDIINKMLLLLLIALLWNITGFIILATFESMTSQIRSIDIIFEQISAFGTVGLSTGITSQLSSFSKIWIILTMFFGRLGPLTIAFAVIKREQKLYRMPKEDILIG